MREPLVRSLNNTGEWDRLVEPGTLSAKSHCRHAVAVAEATGEPGASGSGLSRADFWGISGKAESYSDFGVNIQLIRSALMKGGESHDRSV